MHFQESIIFKEISFNFETRIYMLAVHGKFYSGYFASQECPERQERLPTGRPGDDGGLHSHGGVRLVSYLSVRVWDTDSWSESKIFD